MPSAARLVTGVVKPHGTMPENCCEIRIDVETYAVKAHPVAHADADARDLRLADKDSDLPFAALALDAETSKRGDEPVFERRHEGPHVAAAARKIEHDIGDALAWPMIGEAAAATGSEHG